MSHCMFTKCFLQAEKGKTLGGIKIEDEKRMKDSAMTLSQIKFDQTTFSKANFYFLKQMLSYQTRLSGMDQWYKTNYQGHKPYVCFFIRKHLLEQSLYFPYMQTYQHSFRFFHLSCFVLFFNVKMSLPSLYCLKVV